jgi:hypothetical protein
MPSYMKVGGCIVQCDTDDEAPSLADLHAAYPSWLPALKKRRLANTDFQEVLRQTAEATSEIKILEIPVSYLASYRQNPKMLKMAAFYAGDPTKQFLDNDVKRIEEQNLIDSRESEREFRNLAATQFLENCVAKKFIEIFTF